MLRDGPRARPPTATTSTTSSPTKRAEFRSSHAEVTPWELDRYLQRLLTATTAPTAQHEHPTRQTAHLTVPTDPEETNP